MFDVILRALYTWVYGERVMDIQKEYDFVVSLTSQSKSQESGGLFHMQLSNRHRPTYTQVPIKQE